MARLPQPGGDEGNWGDILNDFLSQAHNDDGTLKNSSVVGKSIADGSVAPVKLSSGMASPSDGQLLSYHAAGQDFRWVAPTSSTATKLNIIYMAEHGVVGDGTTDDTAAIQAAFNLATEAAPTQFVF